MNKKLHAVIEEYNQKLLNKSIELIMESMSIRKFYVQIFTKGEIEE